MCVSLFVASFCPPLATATPRHSRTVAAYSISDMFTAPLSPVGVSFDEHSHRSAGDTRSNERRWNRTTVVSSPTGASKKKRWGGRSRIFFSLSSGGVVVVAGCRDLNRQPVNAMAATLSECAPVATERITRRRWRRPASAAAAAAAHSASSSSSSPEVAPRLFRRKPAADSNQPMHFTFCVRTTPIT